MTEDTNKILRVPVSFTIKTGPEDIVKEIRRMMKEAGFDFTKPIDGYTDAATGDAVYTQKIKGGG